MKWQDGLMRLAEIADKAGIEWWTTGSILLPLNGIDIDINDLDFYFYENDLEIVRKEFNEYIVEPVVCGGSRADTFKYNGLMFIECEICMFAEPLDSIDLPEPTHFGKYAASNLLVYEWNGIKIKAPPIDLYLETLERWGKMEHVQNIRNALKQKEMNVSITTQFEGERIFHAILKSL